ncbi:hypothetical protein KI387_014179 [Taxus chinensis]|uniref:RNase H type-1 domain-containing protein n=1 Tax=Taxus chinensis TaxID=29808 RepID=A0AA38CMS0_TAXCH|nr:hypothetical protein KI387_014179 [Taxus chinensis]
MWQSPPVEWVKPNFDGASKGNPGPTGGGCLIRDSLSQLIFMMALDCGCTSNNIAEGMALLQGLGEIASFHWNKLWIEAQDIHGYEVEEIHSHLHGLMLDPKKLIGRCNIFDVAQGIFGANMLSNASGQFSLHLEHVELEQAWDRRGDEVKFHSHTILMVLQALAAGQKAIDDHLGLELPPEATVNFPCEGTSSEFD